jgi:hypothetical protein
MFGFSNSIGTAGGCNHGQHFLGQAASLPRDTPKKIVRQTHRRPRTKPEMRMTVTDLIGHFAPLGLDDSTALYSSSAQR